MPRITRALPAAERDDARVIDTVILDSERRRLLRGEIAGARGSYAVDLAEPVRLRMGDALALDNGDLIEVLAEAEPLIEVRAADPTALAKLAWALGDRHVPVQVMPNRLRLERDAAIEKLLTSLGGRVQAIEAPFDPEGGAYLASHHHDHHDHHDHEHGHDHHHGHGHRHER